MKLRWIRWTPALAGATIRDRLLASAGAFAGVSLAGFLSDQAAGGGRIEPWLVAPIGASAVLAFAVPASPLAQPWAVVGGNVVAALIGLSVGAHAPGLLLACGLAVGLAIIAMSLL